MKHIPVHHIHVKYGNEIYTISHESGCVNLSLVETFIQDVKKIGN